MSQVKGFKIKRGNAKYNFDDIIFLSESMNTIVTKAQKASRTSSPVIIYGETGTGKELIVQSIHNNSVRSNKPFIAQNCAAIPSNLLESLIFGIKKGSFTGAEDRKGLFELAHGGTLYLDELNSMPFELQSKLLRTIQEGRIRRVGDVELLDVDVRIISSVNENPESAIINGSLRKDLYYRLNVVRLDVPPLRERREDIPILVKYFIDKFNRRFNGRISGISTNALNRLVLMEWNGNVRELEHLIEGIFNIKNEGIIDVEDLVSLSFEAGDSKIVSLKEKLEQFEKKYLHEALVITDYNVSKAAKLLDIPRQTLQYKVNKYGISIKNKRHSCD